MSTNFNDKREKHGNKLRKVNFLTNFMMNKIDNNQEIKRGGSIRKWDTGCAGAFLSETLLSAP